MSAVAPKGPYVYQPHPVSRADGKLWHVGGLPSGMTHAQAKAIVDVLTKPQGPCDCQWCRSQPVGFAND